MVISIWKKDLLIFHDWKFVHLIEDKQAGNTEKIWIDTLPGFDLQLFPFLVLCGRESFNLLNLNTMEMQKFVLA